jgi:3-oxoacyl-[acyl-carrier protein] reductase
LTTIRDKSVLITGAGRGVGKRLAMGFAQAGARVGLLARSQAELDLAKMESSRPEAMPCASAPMCATWSR